jgi:hypothetical protein
MGVNLVISTEHRLKELQDKMLKEHLDPRKKMYQEYEKLALQNGELVPPTRHVTTLGQLN